MITAELFFHCLLLNSICKHIYGVVSSPFLSLNERHGVISFQFYLASELKEHVSEIRLGLVFHNKVQPIHECQGIVFISLLMFLFLPEKFLLS